MDTYEQLESTGGNRRGFWRRLSAWLQPWKRRSGQQLTDEMLRQGEEAPPGRAGPFGDLAWPRRRASQIGRLEEGFDRLVKLVDTIDQHLQTQADRSDQTLAQTRRLADIAAQSQGLQKQRTEAVEEMANQYRTQTRQMQQVAEAVEALPRAVKNQSEQLGQIRDQLEAQLEAQLATAQGVKQLASAADVLRGVADEQRRHFQQMQEANQTAQLQIAATLERQNRRFTWLLGFVLTAALLAAGGAAAAVVLAISRLGAR